MAARSRCAEDELASAIELGATQFVVLGAGLDTYAYRRPAVASELRVFEVDHPATQAWKLQRLKAVGIPIPSGLVFVPLEMESASLSLALEAAGFKQDSQTFFSLLGVIPYLPQTVAGRTLEYVASMPAGSGVVFDYAVARNSLTPLEQIAQDVLARRVARGGEPFKLFFEPSQLTRMLYKIGFRDVVDLGPDEISLRYFRDRADQLQLKAGLARIMIARV
jgi:methyltransferase (TIGR00027 family)